MNRRSEVDGDEGGTSVVRHGPFDVDLAPAPYWEERERRPLDSRARFRQETDGKPPSDYDDPVPYSVAVDEQGYASSGALSDERNIPYRPGYAASAKSVGSTGSQGSGERFTSYSASLFRSFSGPPTAANLSTHNDTRFPSGLSYATSEAGKSDIATVCSGSVVEDIETCSVLSSELNVPLTPSASSSRRSASGGRVEFATLAQYATIQVPGLPATCHAGRASPFQPGDTRPSSTIALNDMGPPLSRGLLLQPAGGGSRPGSVKSFGSRGSDVIVHVDPDDCGGSIIEGFTDGHSVHSQEDPTVASEANAASSLRAAVCGLDDQIHPLLQNSNGRVSPGGTVYKGKGVRRYQGRYMHLPLKRFTQNGINMESVMRDSLVAGALPTPRPGHSEDYDFRRTGRGSRREERSRYQGRALSPPESSPDQPSGWGSRERRDGHHFGSRRHSRSPTSRSRSRSPSRRNSSKSPKRKSAPRRSSRRGEGTENSPTPRPRGSNPRSRGGGRSGRSNSRIESHPTAATRSPNRHRRSRRS